MGLKLNLGCARDIRPHSDGWINADLNRGPGADICFDAGKVWPFPANYLSHIHASHILEHIEKKHLTTCMKEANRCLKPGGTFEIRVPFGPIGTFCNDEPQHEIAFAPTSLNPYCQGNGQNTSLDYDWEDPLFKMELCEVVRIFWQRGRLEPWLGDWISRRYTRPKIGIPVEIHWRLARP